MGLVALLASALQGAVGFGFSLLALSFFLMILGSAEAVQILLVLNLGVSLVLVWRLWREIVTGLWTTLIAGSVLGLPMGLVVFSLASLVVLKLAVAVVLLGFAGVMALRPHGPTAPVESATEPATDPATEPSPEQSTRHSGAGESSGRLVRHRSASAFLVGVGAGAMTTSLGMPGPAVAAYLTGIGIDKVSFRATTLTLYLLLYAAAIVLQAATTGIPTGVWATALVLLPLVAVGAWLGHVGSRYIDEEVFSRVVLGLLGLTGLYVLITTLWF